MEDWVVGFKEDLTGQKFGELTVIGFSHNSKSGASCWNCSCSCGNEFIVDIGRLKHNRNPVTRCSKCSGYKCMDRIDEIVGKKFGMITVNKLYMKGRHTYFDGICNCGNIVSSPFMEIKTGFSRSNKKQPCSCNSCAQALKSGWEPKYSPYVNTLNASIRRAKKKGIEHNITLEYLYGLNQKQDGLCAITGVKMIARKNSADYGYGKEPYILSLDRIDSSKGYIEDNVHLVTWIANLMKMEFAMDQVIETARQIVNTADSKANNAKGIICQNNAYLVSLEENKLVNPPVLTS